MLRDVTKYLKKELWGYILQAVTVFDPKNCIKLEYWRGGGHPRDSPIVGTSSQNLAKLMCLFFVLFFTGTARTSLSIFQLF